MHIEPGWIAQTKIVAANGALIAVLGGYAKELIRQPARIFRSLLAAAFFSVFMQIFHMNVGPSELHFVGAMPIYLTLGFLPTLFGFALGLLWQGLLFQPADLAHLSVNALSLIVPLIGLHYSLGRRLRDAAKGRAIDLRAILKLDGVYYAGVTAMVGFWLLLAEPATPFSAWAAFAASYLAIVAFEPVFTYLTLRLLKRHEHSAWVRAGFAIDGLRLS